jgi:hypothetical protein
MNAKAKAKFVALMLVAVAVSLTACDQIGVKVNSAYAGSAGPEMGLGVSDPYVKFTEAFILSLRDGGEIATKSEPVLDSERETCTCRSEEFPEYNDLPQCFYIANSRGDTEGSGNTFISCT